MRRRPAKLAATGIVLASVAAVAHPARARMMIEPDFAPAPPTFELQGPALGEAGAPDVSPAHLAGSTIAALEKGALALDADSGQLVRLDDKGNATARLDIGPDAAQLVYDAAARRAYVTDRLGDRVVVVEVGKKLVEKARWKTPVEPWGLALSPDGATLLVTTVADRTLLALDTATGEPRWQTGLSREPRGVAFSPDGTSALVGYLTTGTVERFDLETRKGLHVALGTGRSTQASFDQRPVTGFVAAEAPARSFARSAFAVRYLGHDLAIVGFQQSTPVQIAGGGENVGSYGGGFEPPIEHRVAFLAGARGVETPTVDARIASHQPDALGWDAATDRLVIAGLGSDDLIIVTDASQPTVKLERQIALNAEGACGPTGVAVTSDSAWVWCSASRRAARVSLSDGAVAFGKAATKSRRTELEQEGYALFRIGNDIRISTRGAMACSSCHPDNRTDGLSWRIEGHELQTPLLAGRIEDTHPYKWDGGDKDLKTSLGSTMRRLGGSGLGDRQVKALAAYLESLAAPRAPARDRAQVSRGKRLFESDELGCTGCHGGSKKTDRTTHELDATLAKVDTPSLVGVASSAPYYHDGSAATLEALLRDAALVHGMADVEGLDAKEIADLVAYLETL
jgi:cytochrome c553